MTENPATFNHPHRVALRAAEHTRQAAQATAKVDLLASGDGARYAAAMKAADVQFYRTCYRSAAQHGVYVGIFFDALRGLGVTP